MRYFLKPQFSTNFMLCIMKHHNIVYNLHKNIFCVSSKSCISMQNVVCIHLIVCFNPPQIHQHSYVTLTEFKSSFLSITKIDPEWGLLSCRPDANQNVSEFIHLKYTHFQKLSMEKKILNFGIQSELKKMQFATKIVGSMQICKVTANRIFMSRNMKKKGSLIRYQLYEGLQKLNVSADRKRLKLSYSLFSRCMCFYDF